MIEFYALLFLMFMVAVGFVLFPLMCPRRSLKASPWMAIVVILCCGFITVTFYSQWGYAPQLREWLMNSVQGNKLNKNFHDVENLHLFTSKVKQQLVKQPDDTDGWYLLGLVYLSQDHYDQAQDAFEKAYQLNRKNPKIAAQYAKALYLGHHYKMTPQTMKLIKEALKLDPTNETSLQLLALDALRCGHYRQAIAQWQKILAHLPSSSDRRAEYQLAIARVEKIIRIESEMNL